MKLCQKSWFRDKNSALATKFERAGQKPSPMRTRRSAVANKFRTSYSRASKTDKRKILARVVATPDGPPDGSADTGRPEVCPPRPSWSMVAGFGLDDTKLVPRCRRTRDLNQRTPGRGRFGRGDSSSRRRLVDILTPVSRYTSAMFFEHQAEVDISASIGGVGDPFDNALAETVGGRTGRLVQSATALRALRRRSVSRTGERLLLSTPAQPWIERT